MIKADLLGLDQGIAHRPPGVGQHPGAQQQAIRKRHGLQVQVAVDMEQVPQLQRAGAAVVVRDVLDRVGARDHADRKESVGVRLALGLQARAVTFFQVAGGEAHDDVLEGAAVAVEDLTGDVVRLGRRVLDVLLQALAPHLQGQAQSRQVIGGGPPADLEGVAPLEDPELVAAVRVGAHRLTGEAGGGVDGPDLDAGQGLLVLVGDRAVHGQPEGQVHGDVAVSGEGGVGDEGEGEQEIRRGDPGELIAGRGQGLVAHHPLGDLVALGYDGAGEPGDEATVDRLPGLARCGDLGGAGDIEARQHALDGHALRQLQLQARPVVAGEGEGLGRELGVAPGGGVDIEAEVAAAARVGAVGRVGELRGQILRTLGGGAAQRGQQPGAARRQGEPAHQGTSSSQEISARLLPLS